MVNCRLHKPTRWVDGGCAMMLQQQRDVLFLFVRQPLWIWCWIRWSILNLFEFSGTCQDYSRSVEFYLSFFFVNITNNVIRNSELSFTSRVAITFTKFWSSLSLYLVQVLKFIQTMSKHSRRVVLYKPSKDGGKATAWYVGQGKEENSPFRPYP
jgi:hypothetical protein